MFNNIIGVFYTSDKLEEVILSFTPLQGKYVKTLPLHWSQKTIIDNDNEFRIALYVVPNIELKQQILKHGDTVQVIEPQWLADEIAHILTRTLQQYTG